MRVGEGCQGVLVVDEDGVTVRNRIMVSVALSGGEDESDRQRATSLMRIKWDGDEDEDDRVFDVTGSVEVGE